jgi:16S rRNA (cytidine1402-2'-O)-methyltransferase
MAQPRPAPAARPGTLYVVATPLGNLGDITRRALDVLGAVPLAACEDTRRTRPLLTRFGIRTRLVSYHDFNERTRAHAILDHLAAGADAALVSDAGTPMLSDPGHCLVAACRRAGIPVVPVPGPSAPACLLSVSDLPPGPALFAGFPPPRRGERRKFLAGLAAFPWTVVFFEAPHRIEGLLEDLVAAWGDRDCLCGREMTKLHEEYRRDTLAGLLAELRRRGKPKGEFTLAVAGAGGDAPAAAAAAGPGTPDLESLRREFQRLAGEGLPRAEAIRRLARASGVPRNRLYRLLRSGDQSAMS